MKTIDVRTLSELQRDGTIELVDVRTPLEYSEVHAKGAVNLPLDELEPQKFMAVLKEPNVEAVYLICRSGNRSGKAAEKLIEAGITNVVNVEGGTLAWEEAGLPVVRDIQGKSLA